MSKAITTDMSFFEIEELMHNIEQVECPVTHHFSDGVYTRETFMPAGSIVLGKKHKHSTTNIVLKGKISLYDNHTKEITNIEAPCVFISGAGVQKLAYFHEDTIWVNTHPTEETDLDKIESIFIENSTEELLCHG